MDHAEQHTNGPTVQTDEPIEVAQFGHHPDPTTDAEVEVQRLRGMLSEAHAAMDEVLTLSVATPNGQRVKNLIRYWLNEHATDRPTALRADLDEDGNCPVCSHRPASHGGEGCDERIGYSHINGDEECGCPLRPASSFRKENSS
jgi:hypothetical protein